MFEAIRKARPKKLFIVADGPRLSVSGEEDLVNQTRKVVSFIDWPCEVHHIFAKENLGLRQRIFTGLDEVFSKVERAIILEDDCLPTSSFFAFCSTLLDKYSDSNQVAVVSGFNFSPYKGKESDFYFSRTPSIWGWATWSRTWTEFRSAPQVESWSKEEVAVLKPTFTSAFQRSEFLWFMRIANTLNTWDISFFVWLRQKGLLSAIPSKNLVTNIGFGSQATHTKFESFDLQVATGEFTDPIKFPKDVAEDPKLERWIWWRRRLRWLTFPFSHPVRFLNLVFGYLKSR